MHAEGLEHKTRECLALLAKQAWLKNFYLAGGTAVALHLGHRLSLDLDFFSPKTIDPKDLRRQLSQIGDLTVEMEKEGTLWATLNATKISFFHYPYSLIDSLEKFDNVSLAGVRDLSCMKLDTISSRGSKKDFVDLYFILKEGHSLPDIFSWFGEKYSEVNYNRGHLLKSLTYFEDADPEPSPTMIKKMSWDEIKSFFLKETKKTI